MSARDELAKILHGAKDKPAEPEAPVYDFQPGAVFSPPTGTTYIPVPPPAQRQLTDLEKYVLGGHGATTNLQYFNGTNPMFITQPMGFYNGTGTVEGAAQASAAVWAWWPSLQTSGYIQSA